MFCTTCGVRRDSEAQRFCTSCGASFVEDEAGPTVFAAPPPPPPPAPFQPAPRRSARGPVLLIAAIAALACLAGAVVAVVLLRDDDGRRTAADSNGADSGERGSEEAALEQGATPSGSASDTPAATPYTCWNEVPADRLRDCSRPSGREGLAWVFPQSMASGCAFTGGGTRVAEADCDVAVSSGGTVRIHYTEWADWDSAYGEYSGQNVQGAVTSWREFHRWFITPLAGDWNFKVALLYRDEPWSVTVYGHTRADRDEALRELAARPVSDLMGERAD